MVFYIKMGDGVKREEAPEVVSDNVVRMPNLDGGTTVILRRTCLMISTAHGTALTLPHHNVADGEKGGGVFRYRGSGVIAGKHAADVEATVVPKQRGRRVKIVVRAGGGRTDDEGKPTFVMCMPRPPGFAFSQSPRLLHMPARAAVEDVHAADLSFSGPLGAGVVAVVMLLIIVGCTALYVPPRA